MGGRPAKSVKVKAGAIASNDAAVRTSVEDKLRGEAVKPEPRLGSPPVRRRFSGLSWTAWLPERS